MPAQNRRDWLKQTTLAAMGLGFALPSIANEEGITRNFGSGTTLINLGSNENPYGISPLARQAILDLLPEANRYPFNILSVKNFRQSLAANFNLAPEQVLITAGSGEALSLFARHFSKGNIVVGNPTFGVLGNTAKKIGVPVVEVALTSDKKHDLPAMLQAITDKTQLVYIVNPANPTGTIVSTAQLKTFCMEASKKTVVLVDEAYIDFLDDPKQSSMKDLIADHPNVAIVRTFSKIHGMAGLRVGFVMGHPSLIKKLEQEQFSSSQFAVSGLSLAAAQASLGDAAHAKSSKDQNAAARLMTQQAFTDFGISFIPSFTNFIFFQLKNYPGDFAQTMLKKNILLRASDYPDGKWGRVSIGTLKEMQQFVKVIREEVSRKAS